MVNKLLIAGRWCFLTDNFFFQEERAKILKVSEEKCEGVAMTFEDIGRIIGKRWREINSEELARYKEMAEKDRARYKEEMELFYKDELTLMCLGISGDSKMDVELNNNNDNSIPVSSHHGNQSDHKDSCIKANNSIPLTIDTIDFNETSASVPAESHIEKGENRKPHAEKFCWVGTANIAERHAFNTQNIQQQQREGRSHTKNFCIQSLTEEMKMAQTPNSLSPTRGNNHRANFSPLVSVSETDATMENLRAQNASLMNHIMAQNALIEQLQDSLKAHSKEIRRMKGELLNDKLADRISRNIVTSASAPAPSSVSTFTFESASPSAASAPAPRPSRNNSIDTAAAIGPNAAAAAAKSSASSTAETSAASVLSSLWLIRGRNSMGL